MSRHPKIGEEQRFVGSIEWQRYMSRCSPEEKAEAHDTLRKAKAHLASLLNKNPKLKARWIALARPDLACNSFIADIMASLRNVRVQGQYCGNTIKRADKSLNEIHKMALESPRSRFKSR